MKICFFGAYDRNFTSNLIVLKGLQLNNVKVTEVNSHIAVTRLDRPEDMSTIKLIGRVLKKKKIFSEIKKHWRDLKQCDYLYVGYPGHFDVIMAYPLAKLLRKKIIFNPLVVFYTGFVNDQGILKEGSLLANVLKWGEKMIYGMTDIVISDTKLQEHHLHQLFEVPYKKMRTLAIGADDEIYKYSPKKKQTKDFNVVYYGLYSPLHGVEYILDAAAACLKDPSIKFLMVGKGNTYENCVADAKKRKLTNIIFYPEMTEVDAFETLATGDVFLGFLQKHPTVDRVIPNKVYQGLALGKAVVSADSPVMREVFTHGKNVYLCKAADGNDLAKAILELKNDKKLNKTISENGYKMFMEQFTPKTIGKELKKICQEFQAS